MLKVNPLMSIKHYDNVGEGKGAVSHELEEESQAWDDVTGGVLDPSKVVKARMVVFTRAPGGGVLMGFGGYEEVGRGGWCGGVGGRPMPIRSKDLGEEQTSEGCGCKEENQIHDEQQRNCNGA